MINFGLQSGSAGIRRSILNRNESNEKVTQIAQACRKYKLKFAVDCILNLPFDKSEAINESINFFNKLHPDIVNCYKLLYFPGTKIVEIGKEARVLNSRDVEMINKGKRGRYSSMGIDNKGALSDDYRKFALLFTIIPLLPVGLLKKALRYKVLVNMFQKIPLFFLPFIKVAIQLKAGFGFILFNVIGNELFYLKNYFRGFGATHEQ